MLFTYVCQFEIVSSVVNVNDDPLPAIDGVPAVMTVNDKTQTLTARYVESVKIAFFRNRKLTSKI